MKLYLVTISVIGLCFGLAGPAAAAQEDAAQPPAAPATQPAAAEAAAAQDAAAREGGEARPGRAAVIRLDGDINDYNASALQSRFAQARETEADTIILVIDTYGGYVHSGLEMSRFIKRQEDLHVIAYIPEKAISAGAMIAVACNEIVMEPGAMIGNSGVVTGTGQELSGTARAKAESMVLEEFYDSAIRNNHNRMLLEAMVVVERAVHWVERVDNPEERRFVGADEYRRLLDTEQWRPVPDVRDPIDAADTLLTMGTDLAVKTGLAREAATNIEMFALSRDLMIVGRFEPDFGDQVIAFLNGFAVRGLLMTVLLFSLYMSFSTPGSGLPEAAALTALAVLLGVPLMTGYAQWYEIVAVLVGVALIAVEIFLLPGIGIAGITGIILMLGGLTMTFVPPVRLPDEFGVTIAIPWGNVQKGLVVVTAGMLCSLLLWAWLIRYLPRTPRLNRLILTTIVGGGEGGPVVADIPSPTQEVAWPPTGARGKAVTDLRPAGAAEFVDEALNDTRTVDVESDSGFIRAGSEVVVRKVRGSRVMVKAV
jgi:membrane-bound serine protease (ClpP class)